MIFVFKTPHKLDRLQFVSLGWFSQWQIIQECIKRSLCTIVFNKFEVIWFVITVNLSKAVIQNCFPWSVLEYLPRLCFYDTGSYGEKILSNDRTYQHLTIDTKDFVDVVPVDIVNPSHFCCHIVGNAADFKVMTGELNKYYQTTKRENVKWQKMMPCVACYEGMCIV